MRRSRLPVGIAAVALALGLALSAMGGTSAARFTPAGFPTSFPFPYQYSTPNVPKGIGAQGIQGPNVRGSAIGFSGPASAALPQGQVGPGSFTRGTPTLTGIAPCGAAGCTTTISANTTWANETYNLLGNVSVSACCTLTVYDSALTFVEPATTAHAVYGFTNANQIVFSGGSNVTQSSATTRAWFLTSTGSGYVSVYNSSLVLPSNWEIPSEKHGVNVSLFWYSLYFGYGHTNGNVSLNVTASAIHSILSNGTEAVGMLVSDRVTGSVLQTVAPLTASRDLFTNSSVVYGPTSGPSGTFANCTAWFSFLQPPPVAISNSSLHLTSNYSANPVDAMNLRGSSTMVSSNLTYVFPLHTSFGSYIANLNQVGFAFATLNATRSDLNFSDLPRKTIDLGGTTLRLYDDRVGANYTLAQELTIAKNVTANLLTADMVLVQLSSNLWANYTSFQGVGNMYLSPLGGNATFVHDVWPYFFLGNAYAGFSLFTNVPTGYLEHVRLANDTFQFVAYNSTAFGEFERQLYGPIGMDWLFNTNFNQQSQPIGTLGINYTTFDSIPIGPANLFPSADLMLGVNGVSSWIAHDLFQNSVKYELAPVAYQNGTYYLPPYGEDVAAAGGTTYVQHDWFLNLSNETVPVGTNSQAQRSGSAPTLSLLDDHFFYRPTPLETLVPVNGVERGGQVIGTARDHWLTGTSSQSVVTYEIPTGTNTTVASASGGNYVWNTSKMQANGMPSGPYNTPNNYPWGVAPSVDISSGTPTVQYVGIGGSQPNFTWTRHNYTLAIEPGYAQFGADSTSAPPIRLEIQGVPYGVYTLFGISEPSGPSSASLFLNTSVTLDGSGNANVTYSPASMPKGLIFNWSWTGVIAQPALGGTGGGGFSLWGLLASLVGWLATWWYVVVPAIAAVALLVVFETRPPRRSSSAT
ncbi:MAG TPA: hypothetical protein VFF67_10305 [Thermoplasmata archaeon]|nr:hypothetical protein [Thermoplasmata archaeon]